MSGGAFDYKQYAIQDIIDNIEHEIRNNKIEQTVFDDYKYCNNFSDKTITEFKEAVKILKLGGIYAQRVDWLLSGDDGEESFHERLREEKEKP